MIRKFFSILVVGLINIYRFCFSPFLPHVCRFIPTCSEYALEAIRIHGVFKGSWLSLKRVSRCHPWGKHGIDPVPPNKKENKT